MPKDPGFLQEGNHVGKTLGLVACIVPKDADDRGIVTMLTVWIGLDLFVESE